MTRLRLSALCAIALFPAMLSSDAASAQSMYLKKGTSGFGIGGSFATGDDWTGFSLGVGYSISGIADVGFAVGRVSLEDDLTVIALAPSLAACLLKQTPEMPISLELALGYEHDSFHSDALDMLGWSMSGSAYWFGGAVYSSISASPSVDVIPIFGVQYVRTEVKVKDTYGNSVSADDDTTPFAFGISLSFRTPEKRVLFITPRISIYEDTTSFRLSLGFVFPVESKPSG